MGASLLDLNLTPSFKDIFTFFWNIFLGFLKFLLFTSLIIFLIWFIYYVLVIIANKNYKKESIIDSGEDSIIDRLDLIPEEFDVENENDQGVSVPVE